MSGSLTSPEHLIAKVVISGLNWGVKENEEVWLREKVMKGGDKRGRENQSTCKYLIVTISTLKKKLTYLKI